MYGSGLGSEGMAANIERTPPEFQLLIDKLRSGLDQYNELLVCIDQKANSLSCMMTEPEKDNGGAPPRPSGVLGMLYEATDSLNLLNKRLDKIYKHLDKLV